MVKAHHLLQEADSCEDNGVSVPKEYVCEATFRDVAKAYKQTEELLQLENPPSCIIYPDDFAAFGGINAINDNGLRIPEDIS